MFVIIRRSVVIVLVAVGMRVIGGGRDILVAARYYDLGDRLHRQSRDQHHERECSYASAHGWHSKRDSRPLARNCFLLESAAPSKVEPEPYLPT